MLPASVESKVEQTLYITCFAPRALTANHRRLVAASTAWLASIDRIFSATTIASASSTFKPDAGTPMV